MGDSGLMYLSHSCATEPHLKGFCYSGAGMAQEPLWVSDLKLPMICHISPPREV